MPWGLIFRRCEQELGMRKWDVMRYTLSQIINALKHEDPDDPHAGGIPIGSLSMLDRLA